MNDIIERMAKAHYEARSARFSVPRMGMRGALWDELPQAVKDERYDAMWHALKELRVPSDEMVEASWSMTSRVAAAVRMKHELASPKEAHKLKASNRFTAMIDKLLEVK